MESTANAQEHQSANQLEQDNATAQHNDNNAPPVAVPDPPPPPHEDTFPSMNMQYGAGQYPAVGTGWSAMSKIVREVDAEKIQDYKEDIDTILVFAGLFSAVMTAFLIESYQNLSQDPNVVMILLLQQVALQTNSYVINAGFLNSTIPPLIPTLPAFQPSANAIRVNVLWFASLTLSLVSASFGILVKQWLREYLAGEYTSPQARLRIRHFRNPGLDHWKVFEIAAILPLLLQLSLGLFLIGLCFFTADVHSTIGHTTIPLVAGWGFLFIAASFAPALSPRCPYKTTLLKALMKALRKQIFGVVEWAQGVLNRSSEVLTQIPSGKWSYIMLAYDEEDAVTTDSNDIDILIAVDSIQSDEQLLSIMWDALQETQLDPADSVKFVLKIINHRVQHNNLTTTPSQAFLDLKRLPKQTVTSVMLMVSNILRNEINRQSPTNISKVIDWTPWMEDCVFILLSETTSPLPGGVNQMFSLLLADQLRFQLLFDMIKSRVPDPDTFPHVLERLRGALLLLKGDDMLLALRSLVVKYFCHEHNVVHSRLIDVVHEHPEIPSNHLQHLVDLLIYTLTNEMKPDMYWYSYLVDELHLIFALSSNASWRDTVIKLVQTILIQPRNTAIYCRYPMGLDEQNSKLKEEAQELFIDAILAANDADRRTILWNVEQALAWQWRTRSEADDNNWDRFTRIDPLEVVNVLLRLIRKMKEQEVSIVDFAWYFLQSWWDVNEGLRTVAGRHYERHPAIAKECLEFINSLDLSAPPLSDGQDQEDGFANWAHSFPMPESMYPDTLIESLAQFLPVEETTFSHRVRRLRLLQNKDDEQTRDPDWPPNIAGPLTKSFGARERPPSRTRRNRSRRRRRSRSSVQTEQLDIQNVPNADSDSDWATDESNMDGKGDGQGSDTGSKDRASSRERVTVTVNAAESSSDHGDDDDNECQPSPTDTADPDHEVATPVTSEPPCVPAGPATRRG